MNITNIKKKRTTNYIISLIADNEENLKLELSIDLVVKYRLCKGIEIDDLLYKKLIKEQRIIDAKQSAFNYISYRKRSKKQVKDNLKQKYFTDEEIDIAMEYLINNDLLNDEEFAESYTKDILLTKKIGKNKLFNMLYEKGIEKEIIIKTLENHFPTDILDSAIIVAERKYNLIKNKPVEKIKSALFNHLISKGFSFDETNKAINILFSKYINQN